MSEIKGYDGIIGQDVAKRSLKKAVREGTPAHAYVFLGPEGVGKCTTALEFAKALNCLDSRDGDSCGECANCNAFEHGNYPDVRVWSPDGKNTKIDQMRDMRDIASFGPMRGRWKVNIVEQGDTLNEESANCILKLLEEPPDYLINIILYRNAAAMLSTIRSRCRLVRFLQVSVDELTARLVEQFDCSTDQADFLAAYSQGSPGKAIGMIGDTDFLARREEVLNAAARVYGHPWPALRLAEVLRGPTGKTADESDDESEEEPSGVKSGTPKRGKREIVLESLDILTSYYCDLLAAKVRGSEAALINTDKREQIESQAARMRDVGHITSHLTAITGTRAAVVGNANPQIATEALMLQLAA